MDLKAGIQDLFAFLGTPYDEMELWRRDTAIRTLAILECVLETLPYVAFVLLPYLAWHGSWSFATMAAALWCVCEIAYHIYCQARAHSIPKLAPKMSPRQRVELATKVCEHMEDAERDLGGWLVSGYTERVHINDVSGWLDWAFFGKEAYHLTATERAEAAAIRDMLKARLMQDTSDWHGSPLYMRPSLDTMEIGDRPLLVPVLVGIAKTLVHAAWALGGFKWRPLGDGVSYWIREPTEPEDGLPILFIHGIGLGPSMYPGLPAYLARQYPTRRVLLLCCHMVSHAPAAPVLAPAEVVGGIEQMLAEQGIAQVSVLAHSFGTCITSWLAAHRPARIARMTLVDPICFALWRSDVVFHLLYSHPTCVFHHLFSLLTCDHTTRASMHSLWQPESLLFPEAIAVPAHVYLAEHDWVDNAPETYKYLLARKRKSQLAHLHVNLVDMTHGEIMLDADHMARVCANL